MNKKYQQFVPFCLVLAAVLIVILLVLICKPKLEEYGEVRNEAAKNNEERQKLEEQIKKEEADKQAQEIKLRALKPIYKSTIVNSNESLGVFGNMFEDIIKIAQANGLLIRSIEYNMKPTNDMIYAQNSSNYNVCELKFFFIGTYAQMQSFLNDMNKNFEYLVSISNLSITSFPENEDYLLINESITLYSEKLASEMSAKNNQKKK